MSKVEISKVILEVSGKKIELTLEEAKELKDILGELFGKTVVMPSSPVIIREYPHYRPWRFVRWSEPDWQYSNDNTNSQISQYTVTYHTGTN